MSFCAGAFLKRVWDRLCHHVWAFFWSWRFRRHVNALLKLSPDQAAPELDRMRLLAAHLDDGTLKDLILLTANSIEMEVRMRNRRFSF